MRIVDIQERTVPISRYRDPALPSGGLTTSAVAIATDVVRSGEPVIGYGFASIGRFAQGGLMRERFIPRLLAASEAELLDDDGSNVDPFRAWNVMMKSEKPGGHGERCVAVGALDMALWDAAAKIAEQPLYRFVADRLGTCPLGQVRVYAGGGYYYPAGDIARLSDEVRRALDDGYTHVKIKIGSAPIAQDLRRIDALLALVPANHLAVDAMNSYDAQTCRTVAAQLAPLGLWWFEDICDPLDFATHTDVAAIYPHPIAAGEALFSAAEAALLDRYGGLRRERDILLFDPAHCYGLTGYLRIVETLTRAGWPRSAFWPHGGHLFTLHVAAALGLGGSEINPYCFDPFGGLTDDAVVVDGSVRVPENPGIGFEAKGDAASLFRGLLPAFANSRLC